MYADDTVLYYFAKEPHLLEEALNDDLLRVTQWLHGNKLTLNLTKMKSMIIGSNRKLVGISSSPPPGVRSVAPPPPPRSRKIRDWERGCCFDGLQQFMSRNLNKNNLSRNLNKCLYFNIPCKPKTQGKRWRLVNLHIICTVGKP